MLNKIVEGTTGMSMDPYWHKHICLSVCPQCVLQGAHLGALQGALQEAT